MVDERVRRKERIGRVFDGTNGWISITCVNGCMHACVNGWLEE